MLMEAFKDSPNYVPGLTAVLALVAFAMIMTIITIPILIYQNRQADRGERVLEKDPNFRWLW